MAVNQKDKKEKSKTKKQVQNKESKTLRLIKERKRKAQLRTNPALSIYESGRERTKRVVKKEYPLVNINKLPSILTKGNDNIGVVWKNTNKIQSHTLFSTSNLPNREPESKNDYFYLLAPFKEPKSIDIVEELKKYKEKFAKENESRYPDIKSKMSKVSPIKSVDIRSNQFQRKKMNIDNQNKFDTMDNTYEESIKKNFLPLLSTISINPLTKNRFITENGLDKTNKGNNELLHKIKKKINKNKSQSIQNKLSKVNKISDEITINKGLFNNFGTIMNSIQPLESIISAKPFGVNSFITNQGVNIPNMDFFNDSIDINKNKKEQMMINENLILNDGKINHNDFSFENQTQIEKMNENEYLSNLLSMNENDKNLINNNFNQKFGNDLFFGEDFPKSFDNLSNKSFIRPQKPKHSGSLDEILAPFKVPVSSPKVKFEQDNLNKNNSFNSFNCFNIDDMDLPKIKLSQEMKLEEDDLFNKNYNIKNEILKKELENPLHGKNYGTLGEIAKFSTNISYNNKLKNVKMEDFEMKEKSSFDFNELDMSRVKKENPVEVDWIGNSPSTLSMSNLGNNNVNSSLLDLNGNIISGILNTNDNFMNMDNSLMNINNNNSLLQSNDVLNPNMAIECYNTELNFLNSPCLLPNTLDDMLANEIKSKDIILSSFIPESKLLKNPPCNAIKTSLDNLDINTICDINQKAKDEFVQGCCSSDIPLATTTTNLRTIPDWYNQNEMGMIDNNEINDSNNSSSSSNSSSSPQLVKPLAPINDQFLPDISKEILNETNQYTSFLDSEIPLPFEEAYKIINESNVMKRDKDKVSDQAIEKLENSLEKKNDELSENIIDEIIDRLANDDQLKDKSDDSCFIGCTLQETGKLIKKMSNELKQFDLKSSDQLENSEKKWKEWRKEILSYEDEAHQWLNARIEFYSRRVNEYRKDWIEYWIKRYLMQQKQQIKSLSYYINIPQNLQFATSNSAVSTTPLIQTNVSKSASGESNSSDSSEQCTERTTTTSLVAVKADVDRDQRLEVIGRTIDVANKELLNNPTLIEEYHEKLLIEKKLLLEKYDIVDSLDLIPSDFIEPISNLDDNNLININDGEKTNENDGIEENSSMIKKSTSKKNKVKLISNNSSGGESKGFKSGRKDQEEIASVLIDEYVKAPFESKRIFIHGIPKDYQLMFNDKMKSLIFILDKCIQDKKDLYHTMEENRKQYFIKNEKKK